jgi:ribosomal protein S25
MDFKDVAQRLGYANGVALAVLEDLKREGIVSESDTHEGVYTLTPWGIGTVEAMQS